MTAIPANDTGEAGRRRLRLEIQGAVQGVGFRPFVYRMATELGLTGWVINDTQGVFIEVEGPESVLTAFQARLPAEKPPLARIHSQGSEWLSPVGYERFEIRHSDRTGAKTVLVLPDIATCADCLVEVLDPRDRRHRYPFTNCTNCGPRFSIIQALPYDRPNTTMRRFALCPACQVEYDDPTNRRFHAQPTACPVCGPSLTYVDGGPQTADDGPTMTTSEDETRITDHALRITHYESRTVGDAALNAAVTALIAGRILAIKGLGGFHLMVDARNEAAVARLRERKPRRDKPFALMARDLEQVRTLVELSPEAAVLLQVPESPIVLLPKRDGAPLAANVAPGNSSLGVMLPYTPLHHLLLSERGFPVVATSGNLSDEPICTDETEAISRLGHIADAFLIHNRPIERHVDDSVAWIVDGAPRLLRRARGYAPLPVLLAEPAPTLLAVGAHLKNTVALSVGKRVFISQHIGDLETAEAMAAFERVIADFLRLYEAEPVAIAHDLHPDYLSTQWAKQVEGSRLRPDGLKPEGLKVGASHQPSTFSFQPSTIAVQHHHAHLASCLAENGIKGTALGVIWDGTGYGADGTIWGGEFLLGDASAVTRVAHLRHFRLPGGDAAVHEPRRVALGLLWELMGESALDRTDLAPIRALTVPERRLLGQMLAKGVNAPVTTSAGRLFDGMAALLDLHQTVTYEGQAAMALEYVADPEVVEGYTLKVEGGTSSTFNLQPMTVDWLSLVEAVLVDLTLGVPVPTIAARCHNALVAAIVAVAQAVGEPRVALSGGCFQNRLLTECAAQRLRQAGFEVILHRLVPPNDGGISLGQIAVAAAKTAFER